jgi:hypothetical protein
MMTPDQLAVAGAAALCSFLGKAIGAAAGELGKEAAASAKALWTRLRQRWSADPGAQAVATKVEAAPESAGATSMLSGLLIDTISTDEELARELRAFLQLAGAASRVNVSASGDRAVAIGGSNYGNVRTGDVSGSGKEDAS